MIVRGLIGLARILRDGVSIVIANFIKHESQPILKSSKKETMRSDEADAECISQGHGQAVASSGVFLPSDCLHEGRHRAPNGPQSICREEFAKNFPDMFSHFYHY